MFQENHKQSVIDQGGGHTQLWLSERFIPKFKLNIRQIYDHGSFIYLEVNFNYQHKCKDTRNIHRNFIHLFFFQLSTDISYIVQHTTKKWKIFSFNFSMYNEKTRIYVYTYMYLCIWQSLTNRHQTGWQFTSIGEKLSNKN